MTAKQTLPFERKIECTLKEGVCSKLLYMSSHLWFNYNIICRRFPLRPQWQSRYYVFSSSSSHSSPFAPCSSPQQHDEKPWSYRRDSGRLRLQEQTDSRHHSQRNSWLAVQRNVGKFDPSWALSSSSSLWVPWVTYYGLPSPEYHILTSEVQQHLCSTFILPITMFSAPKRGLSSTFTSTTYIFLYILRGGGVKG